MIPELHRFLRHRYPQTALFLVGFAIVLLLSVFYLP